MPSLTISTKYALPVLYIFGTVIMSSRADYGD